MHWIALLAAILALVLARLFRAPAKSRFFPGLLWFTASLLVCTFAIRIATQSAHITRPTDYDRFVAYAAQQVREEPDTPFAVFVGASYSRNGIDDEALTQRLRAEGYPHRVINLSLEGASLQERDAHLWQFMRMTGMAPDAVFLEVSDLYDHNPAYVFEVGKFSDRAIEQFDPNSTYWTLKGLAQGQCHGTADCVKDWVLMKAHILLNFVNIGILSTGETVDEISPLPAFDPQDQRRDTFTWQSEEISAALTEPLVIEPEEGPAWARLFRHDQRRRLQEAGVRQIAYYYPPVLEPLDRAYVADLCAGELSEFPCIAPVDEMLLSQLEGDVWFDHEHLLREGAELYTTWLAAEIQSRGALQ